MLRVTSLGRVITAPGFYVFHQHKATIYTVGYRVEVPVFGKLGTEEKGVCIALNAHSSSDPSLLPWATTQITSTVDELFLVVSVSADNEEEPVEPVFSVVRSDDSNEATLKQVFTCRKNPNKAIRDALESIERDYPNYKDRIHCTRDTKGGFVIHGPRFLGVSLKPVQLAFQQLPLGPLAFQQAQEVFASKNPSSTSTPASGGDGASKSASIIVDKGVVAEGPSDSAKESYRSSSRRSSRSNIAAMSASPSSHTPSLAKTNRGVSAACGPRASAEEEVVVVSRRLSGVMPSTNLFVCPDCKQSSTPFCAVTGEPHLPPPTCPDCGLSSAYCPMTGKPHPGAAVRLGRKRGEVHLPHPPTPRKRKKKEDALNASSNAIAATPDLNWSPAATGKRKAAKSNSPTIIAEAGAKNRNKVKKSAGEKVQAVEVDELGEDQERENADDLTIFHFITTQEKEETMDGSTASLSLRKAVVKKLSVSENGPNNPPKMGKPRAGKSSTTPSTVLVVTGEEEDSKKAILRRSEAKEVKETKRIASGIGTSPLPSKKKLETDNKDCSLLEFLTSKQSNSRAQKPLADLFPPPEVPTLRAPLTHVEHLRANSSLTEKLKQKLQAMNLGPLPQMQKPLSQQQQMASPPKKEGKDGVVLSSLSSVPASVADGEHHGKEGATFTSSVRHSSRDAQDIGKSSAKGSSTGSNLAPQETGSSGSVSFIPAPFKDELKLSLIALPTKRGLAYAQQRGRGRGGRQGCGGGLRGTEEGQDAAMRENEREDGKNPPSLAESFSPFGSPFSLQPSGPQLVHPLDLPLNESASVKRFISFSVQYASERSKIEVLRTSHRSSGSASTSSSDAKRKKPQQSTVLLNTIPQEKTEGKLIESVNGEEFNDLPKKEHECLNEDALLIKEEEPFMNSNANTLVVVTPSTEGSSAALPFP